MLNIETGYPLLRQAILRDVRIIISECSLVNEGIITLPPTEKALDSEENIPSWIKQTVGFWVDGYTTDVEFINAIQYLVKQGVIVLS